MNHVADVTANGIQQGGNDQRTTPNDIVPQVVAVDTPQPAQQQQQQPNNQFGKPFYNIFVVIIIWCFVSGKGFGLQCDLFESIKERNDQYMQKN